MSSTVRVCIACAALLAACGPDGAVAADDTSTGSTSSDANSNESSADSGSDGSDTGDVACEPWTDAAFDWQLGRGDVSVPAAGGPALVASLRGGGIVAAATDETEDDTDVWLGAYAPDGAQAWTLRYEGPAGLDDMALGIAVAGDGSIYVVVREQTAELVSEGFDNQATRTLVVLALEPDGGRRWRWQRDIPPPLSYDNARAAAIAVTSADHVLVFDADVSESIAPPSLAELDRLGNEILRVDLATTLYSAHSLGVAASTTGDVWAVAAVSGDREENWIARLRPDGTIAWEDRGPPTIDRASSVAAGDSDEAYVLVTNGDAEAGTVGWELRRYEPDGAVAWTYEMQWPTGDGHAAAVVVDCDGAPIVAGEISDVPMRTAWIGGITTAGAMAWSSTLDDARSLAPRSLSLAPDGTLALGGLEGTDTLGPWFARVARP